MTTEEAPSSHEPFPEPPAPLPPVTTREKKLLMERVQALGSTEHDEIFKMMTQHGVEHSANKNGVFVNLRLVPDEVLRKVSGFVAFCLENNTSLDEYDKAMNERRFRDNDCSSSANPAAAAPDASHASNASNAFEAAAPPDPVASQTSTVTSLQQKQTSQQASQTQHLSSRTASGNASAQPEAARWSAIRRENTKFNQAMRKYAKRRVDGGAEGTVSSGCIQPEGFLIGGHAPL